MPYSNQIKTVLLLGLLTALLLFVGQLVGGMHGLAIAFIIVLAMNGISYFYSDKIVLAMYHAREIKEGDEPRLFRIVHKVSQLAKVPMPKVYIIPSSHSNAFATGRSPKHAAIAATKGIMDLLDDEELEGVMAHEMAHVRNRDILISTIAATIAGVISYAAMMARWAAIFGGIGGRDRDGQDILSFLVLAFLTPVIAAIIQFAISRSREYIADASGAGFLNNGHGLASALEKLEATAKQHPLRNMNHAGASLFIVNPFRGRRLMNMFSTHPPMDERVKRLKSMHF